MDRLEELRALATGERRLVGRAQLIERPGAVPRAYAVRRVLVEPEDAWAFQRLVDPGFRPRREAVIVDRAHYSGIEPPPAGEAHAPDRVEIRSSDPQTVAIDAHCETDCLLVLTDLHYPGWQVRVDGEEREILRTNLLFRGVRLAPGSHEVVFRYRPASFRSGAALFAITWVGIAAVYVRRRAMQTTDTPTGRSSRRSSQASST